MKTIVESIIGRKGIEIEIWPNPYHLTKKDAIGKIKNWPLEIITLALKEMELQYPERDLAYLQRNGLFISFAWKPTKDGHFFWLAINNSHFDRFYDEYTPEKLKQRLEE